MEPVHLAVALLPLAIYLLWLGTLNLTRRPVVMSGAQNTALLGFAVSGFVFIGPMLLFVPNAAAIAFGPWVWLLLMVFYGLCITLVVLLSRPRLVIYNATVDLVRAALSEAATRIDHDVRWAGDNLVLPQANVQMHIECYPPMRNVSLVSTGELQSHTAWRRLQLDVGTALQETEIGRNPRGFSFLAIGLVLASWPLYLMIRDGDAVAQTLRQMLRL